MHKTREYITNRSALIGKAMKARLKFQIQLPSFCINIIFHLHVTSVPLDLLHNDNNLSPKMAGLSWHSYLHKAPLCNTILRIEFQMQITQWGAQLDHNNSFLYCFSKGRNKHHIPMACDVLDYLTSTPKSQVHCLIPKYYQTYLSETQGIIHIEAHFSPNMSL